MTKEEVLKLFESQWYDENNEKVQLLYYFYLVQDRTTKACRIYKHSIGDVDTLVEDLSELVYDPKFPCGKMPRFYTK